MNKSDEKSFLLESKKRIEAGKTMVRPGQSRVSAPGAYLTRQHIWGTQIITE